MKVLIVGLIYGARPLDIITHNIEVSGYSSTYTYVRTEGISNALNDGLDRMKDHNFDAVAFLANDILESDNWLLKKVDSIKNYPEAGVVASSLDVARTSVNSELIISNWLIPLSTFEKVGYFNESMFPYGPIDLDYCERCTAAGLKTYYVMNCLAIHQGDHASGNEYGWDKGELVQKHYQQLGKYNENNYYLHRLLKKTEINK